MNIPDLVLGTAMWGWTVPPKKCFELLDLFYAQGYRQIDGATNYPINKVPEDFRKAETILQEWITANGVNDLQIMMKVGSLNNMRSPDHNLSKSFLLINLDDYRSKFAQNLDTLMVHWDNRDDPSAIEETLKALGDIREQGIKVGLSGIKHPDIYYELNQEHSVDFRIQCKHNLLVSDYSRYKDFHGTKRFIAYGVNAGGIKFSVSEYRSESSLKARGGKVDQVPSIVPQLKVLITAQQLSSEIKSFNQCGMIYACYHPDMEGVLIGPSNTEQLNNTIEFYRLLKAKDYSDFYHAMKNLVKRV